MILICAPRVVPDLHLSCFDCLHLLVSGRCRNGSFAVPRRVELRTMVGVPLVVELFLSRSVGFWPRCVSALPGWAFEVVCDRFQDLSHRTKIHI